MITGYGARAASGQSPFCAVAMPPAAATVGPGGDCSLDRIMQQAGIGTAMETRA